MNLFRQQKDEVSINPYHIVNELRLKEMMARIEELENVLAEATRCIEAQAALIEQQQLLDELIKAGEEYVNPVSTPSFPGDFQAYFASDGLYGKSGKGRVQQIIDMAYGRAEECKLIDGEYVAFTDNNILVAVVRCDGEYTTFVAENYYAHNGQSK
ncbi:hypothetical protein [Paenibacillus tengchongensis]|uniref:hypothetical protein n=1 Tax=Paenibacillus tengchongensis TaxID=2608684 RepID=UPI00124F1670|nr:hypothetical protein [Paenibacillus tengchongensis]